MWNCIGMSDSIFRKLFMKLSGIATNMKSIITRYARLTRSKF